MKRSITHSSVWWMLPFLLAMFILPQLRGQSSGTEITLPEGVTKIASVEGITEYRLESNGLRFLLFPDPSKPAITVNITYLVGSRDEGYGETGMAHLLEHLVFKGTPRHPDIPQELTEHGARPNGTTWYDRTNYFETFAATEENLRWALDLEADRMVNSFIAKEDLESEMTVVRNEFESGENFPARILYQRVLSTAFLWHNYGQSTIGARSDIENVPIENLQAFYRKYYQPDNAVLMVAGKIDEQHKEFYGASAATLAVIGDFEEADIKAIVEEQFGDWESPVEFQRLETPDFPKQPANEMINTPDKANAMFLAGHLIDMRDDHPDYPALVLGNYMLGGGFLNSRLATRIRQKEGLSYGVGSSFYASSLDESGGFTTYAIYAPENVKKLEQAFREEIEKVQTAGFTDEEVKAAKSGWLQSQQVSRAQDASLAAQLNNYLYLDRTMQWDAELEEKIQNLSTEEINTAMRKYIDLDEMVIIKAGDFEKVDKEVKP